MLGREYHAPEVDAVQPIEPPVLEPLSVTEANLQLASVEAQSLAEPVGPNPWRWLLLGIPISGAAGSIAIAAFLWLTALPPVPDCQSISSISADRERLYCAQVAAESGEVTDLLAGLDLLEQWTPSHPLYQESQTWLAQWSESVLAIAQTKVNQDELDAALELANQIPETSPVYDQAQAAIAQWQGQWQEGEAIYQKAQDALKQKDWDLASQQISALAALKHKYWRVQQATQLSQQILAERQAQKYLAQALDQAQLGEPAQLSAAIKTASRISQDTYIWQEAQVSLDQWSEALLTVGLKQWEAKDLDQAIALGRRVKLNPNRADEAQALIWLSQGRQMALKTLGTWKTSPNDLWQLTKAMLLVSQIGPESRFYPQAQEILQSWQDQLQDVTQLQIAQFAANAKQRGALNFAIAQAQQIEPDRVRRVQAQTLVAYWQQEIERIEDRPYLERAQQLAESDTISGLQAAIVEAKQIQPSRALHGKAQDLITSWTAQIQVIVDQPTLDKARSLATQGQLQEAINTADQIESGRALYREAQAAIDDWQAEIYAIEAARQRRARQARQAEVVPEPFAPEPSAPTELTPLLDKPEPDPVEKAVPSRLELLPPEPEPESAPPQSTWTEPRHPVMRSAPEAPPEPEPPALAPAPPKLNTEPPLPPPTVYESQAPEPSPPPPAIAPPPPQVPAPPPADRYLGGQPEASRPARTATVADFPATDSGAFYVGL